MGSVHCDLSLIAIWCPWRFVVLRLLVTYTDIISRFELFVNTQNSILEMYFQIPYGQLTNEQGTREQHRRRRRESDPDHLDGPRRMGLQ